MYTTLGVSARAGPAHAARSAAAIQFRIGVPSVGWRAARGTAAACGRDCSRAEPGGPVRTRRAVASRRRGTGEPNRACEMGCTDPGRPLLLEGDAIALGPARDHPVPSAASEPTSLSLLRRARAHDQEA